MSLNDTISDIRNVKRSLALRAETDPAKVVDILEKVMRDAVVAQASGSRSFQKKSLQELTQIRKDLIAGQVKAGTATAPMVSIYSNLLDQMTGIKKDNKKSTKESDDAFKHLSNSIPSTDTLVSALMTANPLLGYGVKISRDIYRSSKAFNQKRNQESNARLKTLRDQEAYIQKQMGLLKIDEKTAEDKQKDAKKETKEKDKVSKSPSSPLESKAYQNLLESVRAEIEKVEKGISQLNTKVGELTTIVSTAAEAIILESAKNDKPEPKLVGRGPDGKFVKLEQQPEKPVEATQIDQVKQDEKVVEAIDKVNEDIIEQTKQDKELSLDQIHEAEKDKNSQNRDKKFEDFTEKGKEKAVDLKPVGDAMGKEKGNFSKLIEGLMAPLMLLVRSSIGAFVLGVGTFLLEFIAIPAIILTALYKFLDGFFNAEKIIGKSSENITFLDRWKAAVANLWGSILKIVNWVIKLFGFEGFDTKDIEKKLYKIFDDTQTKIVETFKATVQYVEDKYKSITDSVSKFIDDIFGIVDKVGKFVTDKYHELTKFFDSLANKGVFETFKDLIMEDKSSGIAVPNPVYPPTVNGDVPIPPPSSAASKVLPSPSIVNKDVPVPETPMTYRGDVPIPGKQLNPDVEQIPNANNSIEHRQPKGQQIGNTMKQAEVNADKKAAQPAPPIVIAPNSSDNSVNNHNYMGGPSTSNPDPTFRQMRESNRTIF